MTIHAAVAAVPKAGEPDRALLQVLLLSRVAYVIGAGEDPAALDPRGEDGGPVVHVIGYNGQWFWLDEADATTAHDGVTCIVTAATGGRYKITGVDLLVTHVISKSVTTPPDPNDLNEEARPVNGDAFLVPAASIGDWATKENYIAIWVEARQEWFYIAPKPGWFVWIPDVDQDVAYHYDSVQLAWIPGMGGDLAADGSIPPSALIWDNRVENQTTNSPPATWSKGVAYIIGSSASGDWTGNALKVALALADGVLAAGDVFTIITPWEGMIVYDKALARPMIYSSAVGWQVLFSGYTAVQIFEDQSSDAMSQFGTMNGGGLALHSQPSSAFAYWQDPTGASYAARKAGAEIEIQYQGRIDGDVDVTNVGGPDAYLQFVAALFVDGETNARDFIYLGNTHTIPASSVETIPLHDSFNLLFRTTIADRDQHLYLIRFFCGTYPTLGGGSSVVAAGGTATRRKIVIREIA